MVNIMKKIILATLGMGLLAMGLNTASAGGLDAVGMGGSNAGGCTMPVNPTGIAIGAGTGLVVNAASTGLDVNIVNNGVDTSSEATLTYGGSVCNSASHVHLETQEGGILKGALTDVMPAGFVNRIDYTATATFGTCPAAILTTSGVAAANASSVCPDPIASDLNVVVNTLTTGGALVSGSYADVLTVTLLP